MMMALRYYGEFLSRAGRAWRVEIHQDNFDGQASEVFFPAEEPLVIEWSEVDKLTPLQTSSATLQLCCDSYRQFIDLYAVKPYEIILKVYDRTGSGADWGLYWIGGLDPELYAEPQTGHPGYVVSLTFSDFAELGRIDWAQKGGFISLEDIINIALANAKMSEEEPCTYSTYISTVRENAPTTELGLGDFTVLNDNFYDEEGEAMSVREVLESVLQPLALRMVQKCGRVHVFDLNSAYSEMAKETVVWSGDDIQFEADKIYNRVEITFSPYGDAELFSSSEGDVKRGDLVNHYRILTDYHRTDVQFLDGAPSFDFGSIAANKRNYTISNGSRIFMKAPVYSGQLETGVVWGFKRGEYPVSDSHVRQMYNDTPQVDHHNVGSEVKEIIICPEVRVPGASDIRVHLKLLMDPRYNFEENAGDYNDKEAYDAFQRQAGFVYIPIKLIYRGDDGSVFHWSNWKMIDSGTYADATKVGWVSGVGDWGSAYLCFYDYENRTEKSGVCGWQSNKPMIGLYTGELPKSWPKRDEGDYISLIGLGSGTVQLIVGCGAEILDDDGNPDIDFNTIRWMCYKEFGISLCDGMGRELESSDVEYNAWLNTEARDTLSIETVTGSFSKASPAGKGFIRKADHSIYDDCIRGANRGSFERLLAGTAYSQYAERHDILSGTAEIITSMNCLREAENPDKRYIMVSESQDLIADESMIKMVEFGPDIYTI